MCECRRSRGSEGSSRPRADNETEEQARHLDSLFVAVERLRKEEELFARLQATQPRFQANFGQAARNPFDELRIVDSKIVSASHKLMKAYREGQSPTNDFVVRWEGIIWSGAEEPDRIAAQVDTAVAALEEICATVLEVKPPQP